jgi:hypothetical protein
MFPILEPSRKAIGSCLPINLVLNHTFEQNLQPTIPSNQELLTRSFPKQKPMPILIPYTLPRSLEKLLANAHRSQKGHRNIVRVLVPYLVWVSAGYALFAEYL